MTKKQLKVGDIVMGKYDGFIGVIIHVWDGKYTAPFYVGKQFNPYRIAVRFDQDYIEKFGGGLLGNGTELRKAEHLEKYDYS